MRALVGAVLPLLLTSCTSPCGYEGTKPRSGAVGVHLVGGSDRLEGVHITRLLAANGIDSFLEGSVIHGVMVARKDAARAREILSEERSRPHKHQSTRTIVVDRSLGRALSEPRFAEETCLGRILRSIRVKAPEADDYPILREIRLRSRDVLGVGGDLKVGYYVEVRLTVSLEADSARATVDLQVWDDGHEVECTSGSYQGFVR